MTKKSKTICFILVALTALFGSVISAHSEELYYQYPSEELRDVVQNSFNRSEGLLWFGDDYSLDNITTIKKIFSLTFSDPKMTVLPNLSGFTSLNVLKFVGGPSIDISSLGDMSIPAERLEFVQTGIDKLPARDNTCWLFMESATVKDISEIGHSSNTLTWLRIVDTVIQDDTPLRGLTNIRKLEIDHADRPLSDGERAMILNNTNLTELKVRCSEINDFSFLINCTSLAKLSITETKLSSIDPSEFSKLETLCMLEITDCEMNSLAFVRQLPNLQSLLVDGCQLNKYDASIWEGSNILECALRHCGLKDISFMNSEAFLKTQFLDFTGNHLEDITPIEGLPNLKFLYLGNNDIEDISILANIPQLTTLDLEQNKVMDVSVLQNLTELSDLWLGDNMISDISPLQGLKKLVTLDLGGNQITDIKPLSGLKALQDVFLLDNNQISDFSPLQKLNNVVTLDISNNALIDVSVLLKMKSLEKIIAFSNPSSNINEVVKQFRQNRTTINAVLNEETMIATGSVDEFSRLLDPVIYDNDRLQKAVLASFYDDDTSLTRLDLAFCNYLDLSGCDLQELPDMTAYKNLAYLDVSGNDALDLSALVELPLSFLIADSQQNASLSALYGMTDFLHLSVGDTSQSLPPDVLTWIGQNENLSVLKIRSQNSINPAALTNLEHIEEMELRIGQGNADIDLSVLSGNTKIRSITLEGLKITDAQWEALMNAKSLQTLRFVNCAVSDWSVLQKLKKLTSLAVNGCGINDLQMFARLKKLTTLDLDNNEIVSLKGLEKLSNLQVLCLRNNQVADLTPIFKLMKLKQLYLYGNDDLDRNEALSKFAFTDFGKELQD